MAVVDSYTTGGSASSSIFDTTWVAQTFTASKNYTIDNVKLSISRQGSPGTLTVSIKATSAGLPTGADLTSGTINGNSLDTSAAWVEINLTDYALSSGTKYAIVCRATSGDASNKVIWAATNPGGYANGDTCESGDSGSSWGANTLDSLFETYEASTTSIKTVNGLAYASVKTVNGLAVASVKTINGLA